jgi:two-component system, response regulator, stage 0 sporulation protein F
MPTPPEDDAAERAAEIDHVRALIRQYRRRLRALEQRAAMLGREAPVSIDLEIEDLRTEINDLLERLDVLQGTLPRPVVLVLEPSPEFSPVLVKALDRILGKRYEIVAAATVADVVPWLARRRVPLIVTEYQVGEATVEDLVRTVRAVSPRTEVLLQTTGVYGLTVYGRDLEFHVRAQGVDHFLHKPYAMDWFRVVVEQALERAAR